MNLKLLTGQVLSAWCGFGKTLRDVRSIPASFPVLVTGPMRSGTTWVGAMLSPPGCWHLHEPFNPNRGHFRSDYLYRRPDKADPAVDRFVEALLAGHHRRILRGYRVSSILMPMRWVPVRPPRVLIKDPNACLLSAYLSRRFGFRCVVLFRHPAGWVHSISRLGWGSVDHLRRMLSSTQLMEDHLKPYASLIASQTGESLESVAVLHGCLSTVLWSFCEKSDLMRAVIYEELCDDPLPRFRELYRWLELPYSEETTAEHHRRLTMDESVKRADYSTHEVRRSSLAMKRKWKYALDQEQVDAVRAVWDKFGLPLYRTDDAW